MTSPWNTSSPFDNMVNTYAQAMQKPVVSNPYFWTGTVTANPNNISDSTYKDIANMSDADFNKLSHQEKIDFLAKKRMLNTPSTTPVIAYKGPDGGLYDAYGNGKSPNGTIMREGVPVAPTAPTVDNLIATAANKPRVANGVANRTQVATPVPAPTPTFNYGGSAPTYASSYNLNRDPNYQYSEAYAWRNNPAPAPAPTPWNNGWAKPNPRASSITNYYAGIGY